MTVVLNDKNELIPSRTVTGWRVCIDYRFFQIPKEQDQYKLFTMSLMEQLPTEKPFRLAKKILREVFSWMITRVSIKRKPNPSLSEWYLASARIHIIKIKDKKGAENLAADHLSRLENPNIGELAKDEIPDKFPDEHLMILKAKLNDKEPWFTKQDSIGPVSLKAERFCYCSAMHVKRREYIIMKECHKTIIQDLTTAAKNHFMDLNELMELRDGAYENTRIYKERTKRWHDFRRRGDKDFKNGDKVLLFKSRLKLHLGKLKSKWSGPFIVKTMYPYGAVEITDKNGSSFKVNDQRIKKYYDRSFNTEDNEVVKLDE
ncbi:hypothetical protein Tco_0728244 [Tanacetum coccineum]|uniref:Reverse transcriptase domain-containing protein n=1 Tax=Tanacetum coccineum TaxID=301880 RepID=A0ABQ4YNN4_9ASTR